MTRLSLVLLRALIACSGRNEPRSDSGPSPADTGLPNDAGQVDASMPLDAGGCVDPSSPCAEGKAPSADNPCMPWEDDCDHVHLCGDDEPRWCRPENLCEAVPTCELGTGVTVPSTPCGPSEPNCTIQTMCGQTIFCRPMVDCQEEPTCPPSYLSSITPCGIGEPDCRAVYGCNQARWCRVDPGCDGVAVCTRGLPTTYPCAQDEVHCERVSECGMTVFCRY